MGRRRRGKSDEYTERTGKRLRVMSEADNPLDHADADEVRHRLVHMRYGGARSRNDG